MAPEQARGLPVDGRADLYALGVIAFEMLAGGVPFNAGSPDEVARMQVTDPAPIHLLTGKGVPRVVEEIVARCLEKEPARRHQSARELEGALARAARLRPGELAGVLSEGALCVESGTLVEDTQDRPAEDVAGQGVDTWSAPSRDGPPLILVVDDDPEFRRFAQLVLESFDCVVRTADDGETGLALLREDPPDLVLLDLWMPSIGGFGFLRSIPHRVDGSASFPVILVSGSLTRSIISQAMRIGVRDVLHKPLYPATLSERVWRVLAQEGFTPTS
jgi:CheY-like chemotaxis protein